MTWGIAWRYLCKIITITCTQYRYYERDREKTGIIFEIEKTSLRTVFRDNTMLLSSDIWFYTLNTNRLLRSWNACWGHRPITNQTVFNILKSFRKCEKPCIKNWCYSRRCISNEVVPWINAPWGITTSSSLWYEFKTYLRNCTILIETFKNQLYTEEKIVALIEISYRALSEAADGTEFPWSNKWGN